MRANIVKAVHGQGRQAMPLCVPHHLATYQGLAAETCRMRSIRSTSSKGQHGLHLDQRRSCITHVTGVKPTAASAPPQAPPSSEVVEVDGVSTHAVGPGVHLLRGDCKARLKYEVEYGLKRGTTDNAYVIQTPSARVLIDVPNEAFNKDFGPALSALVPPEQLTHFVITHLKPKSLPTLVAVLTAATKGRTGSRLKVVLSNPAQRLLQNSFGEKPEHAALLENVDMVIARAGSTVSLGAPSDSGGRGRELQVSLTPTPRWPDLMVVYDPETQVLFSSELFSAHAAPTAVGDAASANDVGGWDVYGDDWRYFFECMLSPVARQASAALDKLDLVVSPNAGLRLNKSGVRPVSMIKNFWRSLTGNSNKSARSPRSSTKSSSAAASTSAPADAASASATAAAHIARSEPLVVTAICPMHGPIITRSLAQLLREYRNWTDAQIRAASTSCVAVLYASAYGNTAAIAQAISRGVTKAGVAVDTINLETASLDEVREAVSKSQGFIIGSPTLGGHLPSVVQLALGDILRSSGAKELPCGVFGSFGWSGEAVDMLESRLKDAGFIFGFNAIRVKFKPTAKDLQLCEESGRGLAMAVKRRLKTREVAAADGVDQRAVLASSGQLAMGRVVGSLCVLTAQDEDASSAMLASWISQASFDPPGITVAVKKDRAMEGLLVPSGRFNVSILAEGKDRTAMKRLSRPFAPGEDRLEGLEVLSGEAAPEGPPVLKDANSYLQCQVVSRMEAGDHYVLYANVLSGKVLAESALTSVHHRKVGNHY